jgi:hypothetical protein
VNQHSSTALIKLSYNLPPLGGRGNIDIVPLVSAMALPTFRIDRRPSLAEIPFHDVFFVEVCRNGKSEGSHGSDDFISWMKCVEEGVQRAEKVGGRAVTIGAW